MDPAKKKRLIAAGWKFGSAADLLGMSAAESAYLDLHFERALRRREKRAAKQAVGHSRAAE